MDERDIIIAAYPDEDCIRVSGGTGDGVVWLRSNYNAVLSDVLRVEGHCANDFIKEVKDAGLTYSFRRGSEDWPSMDNANASKELS